MKAPLPNRLVFCLSKPETLLQLGTKSITIALASTKAVNNIFRLLGTQI